jgi:transcriptional regulator with XRE-family HTH domain
VNKFGDLLRSHRQAASLSQEELAIAAKLSTRAIGNMERGLTARPYPRTLRLLACALGLDEAAADELFSTGTLSRRDEPVRGGQLARPPSGTPEAAHGESVKMVRFLARALEAGGVHARELVSAAQIPEWVLCGEEAMVSPYFAMRLWELAEHAFDDPHLPLAVVAHVQPGELDLYDYLFATAPTLRDGFDLSGEYLPLLTTNARLQVEAENEQEVTYSYRYLDGEGRGADLALQFSAAVYCARASAGVGQRVVPLRVTFAQSAPRSHRTFIETFGTDKVEFDAPATTFTFRSQDLSLPMPGADPVLARILTRYADTLSPFKIADHQVPSVRLADSHEICTRLSGALKAG